MGRSSSTIKAPGPRVSGRTAAPGARPARRCGACKTELLIRRAGLVLDVPQGLTVQRAAQANALGIVQAGDVIAWYCPNCRHVVSSKPHRELLQLEQHLCKWCSGRLARLVGSSTAGALTRAVFVCTSCGQRESGADPSCLCWCGFMRPGQVIQAWLCVPSSSACTLALRHLFLASGCDPDRCEVGVVLKSQWVGDEP